MRTLRLIQIPASFAQPADDGFDLVHYPPPTRAHPASPAGAHRVCPQGIPHFCSKGHVYVKNIVENTGLRNVGYDKRTRSLRISYLRLTIGGAFDNLLGGRG